MQVKLLLLLLLFSLQLHAAKITDKYDGYIEEPCHRYLEDLDCDWLKALLYTESLLKPDAVSRVGAMGIGQIMPGTWEDSAPFVEGAVDPYDARSSIRVSAFYLNRSIRFWSSKRSDRERMYLGFASYNAGAGNILKAQKTCDYALMWARISECLPLVTGKHSEETINYVERIKQNFCVIKNQQNTFDFDCSLFRIFFSNRCFYWLYV